jgi:hypothetical protein
MERGSSIMGSRLTQMIQFLYERQRMVFVDPWTDDPAVPAEFKRRWPDATEAETEQARSMASEMYAADAEIRLERGLLPEPPLPGWH